MSDDLAIPLFAIGLPLLVIGTVLVFRFAASRREMDHRERMRSLDLGQPLPVGVPGAALVCTAIGAGVPIAASFFAMTATLAVHDEEAAVLIWAFAMFIAAGGLFAGYRLALRLLSRPASAADRPPCPTTARPPSPWPTPTSTTSSAVAADRPLHGPQKL